MSDISGWRNSALCGFYQKWMAALVVFLIPCIHIGVVNKMLWVPNKVPVNRTSCTCSCFDTVYKGSYESPGKTGYKHIYFNATFDTLIIWIMTFGTIIVAYESFKRLLNLYSAGNLRWRMLLLFILDIYPNYFSYWVYFNYTNDGFYKQVYHQLFFTTTELFSTWNVFRLCAKDSKVEPVAAMSIIVIGLIHIILGGIDQFFAQLILLQEPFYRRIRSLNIVLPDILHVLLTVQEMAIEKQTSFRRIFTRKELLCGLFLLISGLFIGRYVFR